MFPGVQPKTSNYAYWINISLLTLAPLAVVILNLKAYKILQINPGSL